jgi:hypothetical protein
VLTLILLVVLGGGAGLMAVWLIDSRGLSRLLGRSEGRSLRRPRPADTTPPPAPDSDVSPPERRFEPLVAPDPAPTRPGRRSSTRVPAAYTAVEGAYRDVARTPVWHKLVSLVSLCAVLVVIGVTIAALVGATFGLVAELVDSAVG